MARTLHRDITVIGGSAGAISALREMLAGLPADYQAVPMLNLANIASEELSERNLKLMDSIYQRASASAGSFLSTEELAKFQDFRGLAMTNSRGALSMNRVMMAPISN